MRGGDRHTLRFILVGNSGVGKSSILYRFCEQRFGSVLTTVGVDFRWRDVTIDGSIFRVQVWDTAGQEQFKAISKPYYRQADGVLLVYDCLVPQSLTDLESYVRDTRELCSIGVGMILLGNKIDMIKSTTVPVVSSHCGERFASAWDIPFFYETSAATGASIDDAFEVLCRHVMNNQKQRCLQPTRSSALLLATPSRSVRHTLEAEYLRSHQSPPPSRPEQSNNFERKTSKTSQHSARCCS